MRKLKLFSLAVLFASTSCLTSVAHDFTAVNDGQTIYFNKLSENTCAVTYCGSGYFSVDGEYYGNLNIPSTVVWEGNEYSVVKINDDAFVGCPNLESVVIPSSVTSIGDNVFAGCNVTSLSCSYPFTTDGVSIIDSRDNTLVCYYNGTVENYSIPVGVKNIRQWAFWKWSKLKTLTLPEGVETISHAILLDCRNVEFVNIPSTVKSIGNRIFEGPTSKNKTVLISVPNPSSISLQSSPFNNAGLWTLLVPEGCVESYQNSTRWMQPDYNVGGKNTVLESKFSCKNTSQINGAWITNTFYYNVTPGKTCEVTSQKGAQYFKEMVIPATAEYNGLTYDVTSIGDKAFKNETGLMYVYANSKSLTNIGEQAFTGCSSLREFVIGSGVKEVGDNVFGGCSILFNVTSYAIVPPTINGTLGASFGMIVPNVSLLAYEEAGWPPYSISPMNRKRTLSISSPQLSTLWVHYDTVIPEGVEAYYAESVSDDKSELELTKFDGKVLPRETGIIIKGSEGTYVFNESNTEGEKINSILVGTNEKDVIFGNDGYNYYKLTYADGTHNPETFGFYLDNPDGTVDANPNKAYLKLPQAAKASYIKMRFIDDEMTDIQSVANEAATNSSDWYNLAGQKVGAGYKGIVIKNGKKIIIK